MTLQEVYGLPVTETHTAPTAVTEYLIPYGAHYNVVPELESFKRLEDVVSTLHNHGLRLIANAKAEDGA